MPGSAATGVTLGGEGKGWWGGDSSEGDLGGGQSVSERFLRSDPSRGGSRALGPCVSRHCTEASRPPRPPRRPWGEPPPGRGEGGPRAGRAHQGEGEGGAVHSQAGDEGMRV